MSEPQIELAFIAGPAKQPELCVVLTGGKPGECHLRYALTPRQALDWAKKLIERTAEGMGAAVVEAPK